MQSFCFGITTTIGSIDSRCDGLSTIHVEGNPLSLIGHTCVGKLLLIKVGPVVSVRLLRVIVNVAAVVLANRIDQESDLFSQGISLLSARATTAATTETSVLGNKEASNKSDDQRAKEGEGEDNTRHGSRYDRTRGGGCGCGADTTGVVKGRR